MVDNAQEEGMGKRWRNGLPWKQGGDRLGSCIPLGPPEDKMGNWVLLETGWEVESSWIFCASLGKGDSFYLILSNTPGNPI